MLGLPILLSDSIFEPKKNWFLKANFGI
jgi:hypothetical protein